MKVKSCFIQVIACILCILIAATTLPVMSVSAQDGVLCTDDGFDYQILNNEITIIKYTGVASKVKIPNEIDGYPVTTIGNRAFDELDNLTEIVIPANVVDIYTDSYFGSIDAFRKCDNLSVVTVDENNLVFDSRDNCNAIIKTESNTLFFGCQNTVIPNSVSSIGEQAFNECVNLESITIPNSVTKIGDGAFRGCINLKEIAISDSVKNIGENAFMYCKSLETIDIPASVSYIGDGAFYSCESVKKIVIPDGITKIGTHTFNGCLNMEELILPDSVTSIGYTSIANCRTLKEVIIPKGVTKIEVNTFLASGVERVVIPEGVYEIEESAFSGCFKLKEITLPSTLSKIRNDAFSGCKSIESIFIPANVTEIEDAFSMCYNLSQIEVDEANQKYDSRNGCNAIIETSTDSLLLGCPTTIIPDSVKIIGTGAFWGYDTLDKITVPEGVTTIGEGAFGYCEALEKVELPKSLKTLEYGAFQYCKKLDGVELPQDIEILGDSVFEGCESLTSLEIPAKVSEIYRDLLKGCTGLVSLSVDENNKFYDSRENCNAIISSEFNSLEKGCINTVIPEGVVCISEYAFDGCTDLTEVKLPESLNTIDRKAFQNCVNLKSIYIPANVYSVDEEAFLSCNSLENIVVDTENLNYDSRDNCNAIIKTENSELVIGCKNTVIPDSIKSIGADAFSNCDGITEIAIPDSVTEIGYSAFSGCSNLRKVILPSKIENIKSWTFGNCKSLTEISIPDTVISIENDAFYGCEGLKAIEIPDGVKKLENPFDECSNLESIFIPVSVTDIYDGIFAKTVSIYGYSNSYAEAYAESNGNPFVSVGEFLQDENTGISVMLSENLELSVTPVTDEEAIGNANTMLKYDTITAMYDINLSTADEVVQPNDEVTVKIPTEDINAKVYHINEDGTLTDMDAVYKNGYVVFTTDSFSVYVLSTPAFKPGDVNLDGKLNVRDATVIQKFIAQMIEIDEIQLELADFNDDGKVNVKDATAIQKTIAGII